jgi:hypothetical protein
MLSNMLRNCTIFVAGTSLASEFEEVQLPAMKIKEESFRAGGMDAPVSVDMGMEELEATFTSTKISKDILSLFGIAPGRMQDITCYGALVSETDGTTRQARANMTGNIRSVEPDAWKPGEKAGIKFTAKLSFYELLIDGDPVYKIDIPNYVREIGGVDQLAEMRAALGLG